ncbi:hypothetical protein V8E53_005963 [Lactarius tabidus]
MLILALACSIINHLPSASSILPLTRRHPPLLHPHPPPGHQVTCNVPNTNRSRILLMLPGYLPSRLRVPPKTDKERPRKSAFLPVEILQLYKTTSTILTVLQDQVREFDLSRNGDERLTE